MNNEVEVKIGDLYVTEIRWDKVHNDVYFVIDSTFYLPNVKEIRYSIKVLGDKPKYISDNYSHSTLIDLLKTSHTRLVHRP